MKQNRYIIRIEDGELFGWYEPWLKQPGFVEYDPTVHGYRAEVAASLGLVEPAPTITPKVTVSEHVAGQVITPQPAATERKAAQVQTPEPDLSDVFGKR